MDIFRTQTESIDEENVQLSREDCMEMVAHKTCNKIAMNCDSDFCFYSNKPKIAPIICVAKTHFKNLLRMPIDRSKYFKRIS